MKAILEFNLPEEHAEHIRAVHAMDAWAAISEIRNNIRAHNKHGGTSAKQMVEQILLITIEIESLLGE